MDKHFLLCTERSGSNLITKLMNAHSKICGPSTKHLMNPIFRNLFRYEPLERQVNWEQLIEDMLRLFNVDFSHWQASFDKEELLDQVEKGDYIALINYFYDKEAQANGKEVLFIKENQVYEYFPYLYKHFPNSKFLYQVRDPRDVALSWKKNPAHKGGIVNAANQWKKDQQQLLKLSHVLQEEKRVVFVTYENLVSDTPKELTKVFDLFGMSYEDQITEFHKDSLTQKNSTTQHAWNNLSKEVMTDNYNKFLKELEPIEIRIIEKICINEMLRFGYKPVNERGVLEATTEDEIEALRLKERSIKYDPAQGIIENMKAKKIFYEKKID